jgi:N-acetylglucosaminyldiphosphoundecaprenol N-acetyl-beta-D-mannosaminyltransferase
MQASARTSTAARSWTKQLLFGIPVDAVRLSEVIDLADEAIRERRRLLISTVNAAKIVAMGRDVSLRSAVLRGDLILADGMSVVWAARLLDGPLPERVAGIDVMFALLRLAAERRYRVYLFGATPSVLSAAEDNVGIDHQGVEVVGSHHGYYAPGDESRIADEIREGRPDILFVANSSPAKEKFLAQFVDRMNVPVCLGVGGAFDVLGGKLKRAPEVWQRLGLEWAYRLAQEPVRLWRRYLDTNLSFAWLTVNQYVASRRRGRS